MSLLVTISCQDLAVGILATMSGQSTRETAISAQMSAHQELSKSRTEGNGHLSQAPRPPSGSVTHSRGWVTLQKNDFYITGPHSLSVQQELKIEQDALSGLFRL